MSSVTNCRYKLQGNMPDCLTKRVLDLHGLMHLQWFDVMLKHACTQRHANREDSGVAMKACCGCLLWLPAVVASMAVDV